MGNELGIEGNLGSFSISVINYQVRKVNDNVLVTVDKIQPRGVWITEICLIILLAIIAISWECWRCKYDQHRHLKDDDDPWNIEGGLLVDMNHSIRKQNT
jgi:hypothetical protein